MTQFHISEEDGLSLVKTYADGKEISIPLEIKKATKDNHSWECADDLDPFVDVILQALHGLPERSGEEVQNFISSPKTERHQFLKWLLTEEMKFGDSKWTKALRRKLAK